MGPVESEFNVDDYPPEFVAVGVSDVMPAILEMVEDGWSRTPNVVLVVPRGAQAFHNTQDFLALGRQQGGREVRVSIATLDPIIAGLGRLLGFHVVDPPPDHPSLAGDPALENTTLDGVAEQATAPLPMGTLPESPEWVFSPSSPAYPAASTTTSTWLANPADPAYYVEGPQGGWANAYSASAHHPGMPPPRTRQRQTGHLSPPTITEVPRNLDPAPLLSAPTVSTTPTGRIKARRVLPKGKVYGKGLRFRYGERLNRARVGRWLVVAAIVLVVALVGGSAYAYVYLPEATVSVTPLNTTITNLTVEVPVVTGASTGLETKSGLAAPPGQVDAGGVRTGPSLIAEKISVPLTEEGTRPAGGTRQVPRGKAQGTIRFTNRTGGAVQVPAGTQFKAPNGIAVQTTQAGVVPATVFGQSFGTIDLPVAAMVDGPDGNISAGQISGVYNGVLNYSNSALQGGTMETLKVVTQGDIDALAAELRARVEERAASAVLGQVGAGQQLITQTISLAGVAFKPDVDADKDAEAVRMVLTATADAYTYRESDLQDSVAQAVLDAVQTTIPRAVGPSLDLNSVRYSTPEAHSVEAGRVVYRTSVQNARVTYALTPELATQIRSLVRGKGVGQARNLILQSYGTYLNPDSIEARVLWFTLDRLPNDPARISVEPSGKQESYPPGLPPPGVGTPDPREPVP